MWISQQKAREMEATVKNLRGDNLYLEGRVRTWAGYKDAETKLKNDSYDMNAKLREQLTHAKDNLDEVREILSVSNDLNFALKQRAQAGTLYDDQAAEITGLKRQRDNWSTTAADRLTRIDQLEKDKETAIESSRLLADTAYSRLQRMEQLSDEIDALDKLATEQGESLANQRDYLKELNVENTDVKERAQAADEILKLALKSEGDWEWKATLRLNEIGRLGAENKVLKDDVEALSIILDLLASKP